MIIYDTCGSNVLLCCLARFDDGVDELDYYATVPVHDAETNRFASAVLGSWPNTGILMRLALPVNQWERAA